MHPVLRSLAERRSKLEVTLKNNIILTGKLEYVDSNLNMQLSNAQSDSIYFPGLTKCFIRGSSVKFLSLSNEDCSADLLDQILAKEGQLV